MRVFFSPPLVLSFSHFSLFEPPSLLPPLSTALYKVRPPGEEPAGEDGDEAEEEDEAEAEEEGGSRTRTMPRWLIRQPLRLALGAASPVVLANSKWKGAVAFADDRGNKFGNLYVGYGVPTSLQAFAPDLLGELQVEGAGATMVKVWAHIPSPSLSSPFPALISSRPGTFVPRRGEAADRHAVRGRGSRV